jgi:hypothetical protein
MRKRGPYKFGLSAEERLLWRWFQKHRIRSLDRGIEFLLTFEEWLKIWTDSGHLYERGQGKEKYCMARYKDKGPYAVGNVRICKNRENQEELLANPEKLVEIGSAMRGKKHRIDTRKRMSRSKRGNQNAKGMKHSAETKEIIGAKSAANWVDPVYAAHGSEVMLSLWEDPQYRAKVSAGHQKAWDNPERRRAASERMRVRNQQRREAKCPTP